MDTRIKYKYAQMDIPINVTQQELAKLVSRFGNVVIDVTPHVERFVRESKSGNIHIICSAARKVCNEPRLLKALECCNELRVEVACYETLGLCVPGGTVDKALDGNADALFRVLCCSRGKITKSLNKLPATATEKNIFDAAANNTKMFGTLFASCGDVVTSDLLAKVITDPETLEQSIGLICKKINVIDDPDAITCAVLKRFGTFCTDTFYALSLLSTKSEFRKTLTVIAKEDLPETFKELRKFVSMKNHEMVELFCEHNSQACLRLALSEVNSYMTHENVLKCLDNADGWFLVEIGLELRAIKEPVKLLDHDLAFDRFEQVRKAYDYIPSSELTNAANMSAILIAETIMSTKKNFSDLPPEVLPPDISRNADNLFVEISDSMALEVPTRMNIDLLLATLKHHRGSLRQYDVEYLLRNQKLSKKDESLLLDLLQDERDYYLEEDD